MLWDEMVNQENSLFLHYEDMIIEVEKLELTGFREFILKNLKQAGKLSVQLYSKDHLPQSVPETTDHTEFNGQTPLEITLEDLKSLQKYSQTV